MRIRLKENAEEKLQYDKESKELISNISHDLKTPITAIKGYVEGILDGVASSPEKLDRYIRTIYNKANDMDRLIDELTFYSKIDTNKIPYTFAKINVSQYFKDCLEEVGLDMEARGIELGYFNYADEDVMVIADAEQIKRVVNNIVSNMTRKKGSSILGSRMWETLSRLRLRTMEKALRQRIFPTYLTVFTVQIPHETLLRAAAGSDCPLYARSLRIILY